MRKHLVSKNKNSNVVSKKDNFFSIFQQLQTELYFSTRLYPLNLRRSHYNLKYISTTTSLSQSLRYVDARISAFILLLRVIPSTVIIAGREIFDAVTECCGNDEINSPNIVGTTRKKIRTKRNKITESRNKNTKI